MSPTLSVLGIVLLSKVAIFIVILSVVVVFTEKGFVLLA
jgi:hypothetical protein